MAGVQIVVGQGKRLPVHRAALAVPAALDHIPPALAETEWLYACEAADERTIQGLAAVAGCTVAELEARRLDYVTTSPERCRQDAPPNRRRCHRCPWWDANPNAKAPF
ncbi:MAG: hypothetical protein ACRD0K_10090 [Egibacteraceae bacterium]